MLLSSILAATLIRFLDPHTCLYQTDNQVEGARISNEPGYWAVPNGLFDQASATTPNPKPRIIHSVYRVQETPYPEYSPDAPSPLFKINQAGYLPDRPKFAYLGAWLGPALGAWHPHMPIEKWELIDANTGEIILYREVPGGLRPRLEDVSTAKSGIPLTGEAVFELDFSQIEREGLYYLRIPGIGRSADFRISRTSAEDAFRVHMLGLYHKRCGIAKVAPYTKWLSTACHSSAIISAFPPEEGKVEPNLPWFEIINGITDWKKGQRVTLQGGWHDAADFDRRPWHLGIVDALCAVYLMRPDNFSDGQLAIPENGNGIPDILDEAAWGLRHLLTLQQADGGIAGAWIETTRHPPAAATPAGDTLTYAISRATRSASLAFAARASLLARCNETLRASLLQPAIRAWNFALLEEPQSEVFEIRSKKGLFSSSSEIVYWDEPQDLPAEFLIKAAINLCELTGDKSYLSPLLRQKDSLSEDLARNAWKQSPLLFTGERAAGLPNVAGQIIAKWEKSKLKAAQNALDALEKGCSYRTPWRMPGDGWVESMGFGAAHPLVRAQLFVMAHSITGDSKYIDAISLANDFHCGCNPQGTTLTSGLGQVYPVAFLEQGRTGDFAEYIPGITPYRWANGIPARAVELVWKGNRQRASAWPLWRRWWNLEGLTPGASEYTVWETIAPAAAVTGYLLTPSSAPPPPPRTPARNLTDLPGYWVLP